MSDPTVDKTELIIEILHYAQEHDLDINDKEVVKRILKEVGADQSDSEFEELMELLQNADTFMEMTARNITNKKAKQSN